MSVIRLTKHAAKRISQRLKPITAGDFDVARRWVCQVTADSLRTGLHSPTAPGWIDGRGLKNGRDQVWIANAYEGTAVAILANENTGSVITVIVSGSDESVEGAEVA